MDFTWDLITASSILVPTVDTATAVTLAIGGTTASAVTLGKALSNVNVTGNLQLNSTVQGSTTAGQIIVTAAAGVAAIKAASFVNGQVLTIDSTAVDATNVAWKTLPVATYVGYTSLVLTGQAAIAPVTSIDSDLSVYSVVQGICHMNIDVNLTMSGAGADTIFLDFNAALSPGITCTGTSRFIGECLIESASTFQTGFIHILSSFSGGTRLTVYTTGFFAASTAYRVNGSLQYKIN